jgi:hypothetical protein
MGFGGFSLFGSMLLHQRAAVERMINPQAVATHDATMKFILPIVEDIKSGDAHKMETGIRNFLAMLGMLLGIKDNIEIEDLALMSIAAQRSGKLDNGILDDVIDLASGKALSDGSGRSREIIINNLIVRMLVGLVDQWIESFGKPVITTTFTEEQVKLVGNHYDYTSGKRAARVLAKLTEYNAYLSDIGMLK